MFRVHATVSRPELFSALVLLDPVIVRPQLGHGMVWADAWGASVALTALLDGAVVRKNGWGSKYVLRNLRRMILIRSFLQGGSTAIVQEDSLLCCLGPAFAGTVC